VKALFITGAGTGVGKTFVAAALAHQLSARGKKVVALKPVATGFRAGDPDSDPAIFLRAAGLAPGEKNLARISPWRYAEPLSPDQAARHAGKTIAPKALVEYCRAAIRENQMTLIEGIGGAFTPLAENFLVADWIKALRAPFLLVTGSYLGTLTHTLATLEALGRRKLAPKAIVVSQPLEAPVPLRETLASLTAEAGGVPVFPLPHLAGNDGFAKAPDLTHLLK
jgi:dethiobiotin synthetase